MLLVPFVTWLCKAFLTPHFGSVSSKQGTDPLCPSGMTVSIRNPTAWAGHLAQCGLVQHTTEGQLGYPLELSDGVPELCGGWGFGALLTEVSILLQECLGERGPSALLTMQHPCLLLYKGLRHIHPHQFPFPVPRRFVNDSRESSGIEVRRPSSTRWRVEGKLLNLSDHPAFV